MNGLNNAFYFVTDKIIELQAFFIDEAWTIGRVVLLIAICSAAANYAMTGTGLKENVVKIIKAVVFFVIVMGAYPRIVSWITSYAYNLAEGSTYEGISTYITDNTAIVREHAETMKAENQKTTYGGTVVTTRDNYFGPVIINRTFTTESGRTFRYSTVAPAAALQSMLLVAGECVGAADKVPGGLRNLGDKLGMLFKGLICALFIIVCGSFALLEYLIAFLEFMFVTSVGIICFPLSLWDGSKFMAEKFISALLGFFIKLLFCTICIFLMLYGFLALAKQYTEQPFTGLVDQMLFIIFTCLLFYFLCKSAPALAQSLLTGTPSLNAAGAIGAAATAMGAVAGVAGLGARAGVGGTAALARGEGAFSAAAEKSAAGGGSRLQQMAAGAGAFAKSLGHSGAETMKAAGSDLTRSLLSRPLFGGHGAGSGGGVNKHSATQRLLQNYQNDGARRTLGEFAKESFNAGKTGNNDVVANHENKNDPKRQ